MPNFAEMASLKDEDLPEVKKLPMGTYEWEIDRLPETKPSKSGNGENITFRVKCIAPVDPFDGDDDDLETFGSVKGLVRIHRFYFPTSAGEDGDGRLANNQARAAQDINTFLKVHCGVEGDSMQERMANCLRHHFIGSIRHVPDGRDPKKSQEEFGSTAPVSTDD
jgi:hypothetical protein